MIKKITVIFLCLLPFKLPHFFLDLLGFKISYKSKIGFSIISISNLSLSENSKIGHFNFIFCDKIELESSSYIGHFNIIKGPFSVILNQRAAVGNFNKLVRAKIGVTYDESRLKLGELSKITSSHYIDLTKSIEFGSFSTLAGVNSQIWTHGYVHESTGAGRIRVDGEVKIGNNVYIGSSCIFNPGIKINDSISVGSGSVLSKNLIEKGLYVNQSLRLVNQDIEDVKRKLDKLQPGKSEDNVFIKKYNG